jgi:hypothetical protein
MPARISSKSARETPTRSPSPRLHFYVYTVAGMLDKRRQTFRVMCCHASDARAMIAERCPAIGDITVTRGIPVHYIAIGDHLLHE